MSDPDPGKAPRQIAGMDPLTLVDLLEGPGDMPVIPKWNYSGIAGSGGFGIVWKAVSEVDEEIAAVKIAPPSDPETLERIEGEAEALRALRHPNIVSLLDSGAIPDGEFEGGLFLAMEFIDGPSLEQEIPQEGLAPDRSFDLFLQIGRAIMHAHDQGILHRDLKPSNIHLTADGIPKVADFGLARPVHRRVQQLSLTRAGLVAGTAEYLPPEAYIANYQPSVEADIFALGVILYEMLSGSPPRGAWQPISSKGPVDIRIDQLIRRALDPDPAKRWPSVEAMLHALEGIRSSPPRYSGFPIVTPAVRALDFLWTVVGLFMFVAGLSSLLHLAKSRFELPLNLIDGHGELAGGFQALMILLLVGIPLGLWQLIRLRKFRGVPMREALPSPLGLSLGTSRAAVAVVVLGQLLCLFLPVTHALQLHFDCNLSWLNENSPPWAHGLSVTPWDSMAQVPPWSLPEAGEKYWLHETFGVPGHPLTREEDRLQFFPFFVPMVMATGGGILLLAVLTTLTATIIRWWRYRRRWRPLLLALLTISWCSLYSDAFGTAKRRVNKEANPERNDRWAVDRLILPISNLASKLLSPNLAGTSPVLEAHELALYAEQVEYRGKHDVSRDQIPEILASAIPAGRSDHILSGSSTWDPITKQFEVVRPSVHFSDGPGLSRGTLRCLRLSGEQATDGSLQIHREILGQRVLYEAQPIPLDEESSKDWLERLAELGPKSESSEFKQVFHPCDLHVPNARPDPSSKSRRRLIEEISADGRFRQLKLNSDPNLTGGRQALTFSTDHLDWYAALVHTDHQWKCVRLRLR